MFGLLCRLAGIWLVIAVVAIINGVFRELVLVPAVGASLALPVSGLMLAILVLLVTSISVVFLGLRSLKTCIWAGLLWVVFTLSFEFLFGHYVTGKSWWEIARIFDFTHGDLFTLVLVTTAVAPLCAAKLRSQV
jgi:hypothetical protein